MQLFKFHFKQVDISATLLTGVEPIMIKWREISQFWNPYDVDCFSIVKSFFYGYSQKKNLHFQVLKNLRLYYSIYPMFGLFYINNQKCKINNKQCIHNNSFNLYYDDIFT